MKIKKELYERKVEAAKEILQMQGKNCPPEMVQFSFPLFPESYWWEGPNGCDFADDRKMDFYLSAMLLYTAKDDNGEYLYQPYMKDRDDEELEKTRSYIESMLEKHIELV